MANQVFKDQKVMQDAMVFLVQMGQVDCLEKMDCLELMGKKAIQDCLDYLDRRENQACLASQALKVNPEEMV